MPDRPHVCVFCGSSRGASPAYTEAARRTGSALARHGLGLVYGGGRVGLMGVVADAALAEGGRVVGIIPDPLAGKEIAHGGLTELIVVPGMHERKALMASPSSGFLTLPGDHLDLIVVSDHPDTLAADLLGRTLPRPARSGSTRRRPEVVGQAQTVEFGVLAR